MKLFDLSSLFKTGGDKLLSIDFGNLFVKIAYLERRNSGLELVAFDTKKITPNNENIPQAAAFITAFLKANAIQEKKAYLTISDPNCIIVKHLIMPELPKNETLKAIQWQIKDEIEGQCDGALMDWRLIKEFTEEDGAKKQEVMFVCLKGIGIYLDIVRSCGILPLGISHAPFNYANVLKASHDTSAINAVLDIGSTDSTLCIYRATTLAYLRRLTFCSEKLTQSLTDTLLSAKGPIQLPLERAEYLRNTYGIITDEAGMLEGEIPAMHVASLMRPLLESLVREVRNSFEYFSTQFKETAPAVVYLTGGGANLKNLESYLSKELGSGIKVLFLSLPQDVSTQRFSAEAWGVAKNQLMSAVGAALAGAESVKFIPPEVTIQRLEPIEKKFLRLVAVAIFLSLAVSYYLLTLQIAYYKKRIANFEVLLQKSGEVKPWVEKVAPLEEVAFQAQRTTVPADGLLKVVSAAFPASMAADEIIVDQQADSLIIKGFITNKQRRQEILDKAMQILSGSNYFKGVNGGFVKSTNEGEIFQIQAQLAQ